MSVAFTRLRYLPARAAGRGVIAQLVSLRSPACGGSYGSGPPSNKTSCYCCKPWPVLQFVVLSVCWLPNKVVPGKGSLLFQFESEPHAWVKGQTVLMLPVLSCPRIWLKSPAATKKQRCLRSFEFQDSQRRRLLCPCGVLAWAFPI